MESPQTNKIKIVQPNEVPVERKRSAQQSLCSFPLRLIFEGIAVFLIVFTLFIFTTKWPSLKFTAKKIIMAKSRFAPNSEGFKNWMNPPVKTTRAYRLFNVLNYKDIMTSKNNPPTEVVETSPFMYQLVARKAYPTFSNDSGTIFYGVERIFTREGKFSEELLNEQGAFVDVPRAMYRTKFDRKPDQNFFLLGGFQVFNYSKAIDKIEGYISNIFSAISAKMIGPNTDKYGFIYRYNGSVGFNYTIKTGINDSSVKGQVVNFASFYSHFTTTADQWQTDFFDGLTFPIFGNYTLNQTVINVFQPDFCRPIQLRYNRTLSKFGYRELHEFVLKLVDVKECPEMDANCPEVSRLDISKCLSTEMPDKTIYLTKPHMFGHDSSSLNVNFQPDFDKHESTIYFDTLSGSPVRAQLRLQLNIQTPIDRIIINKENIVEADKRARGVDRFIPLLWIDQTININENVGSKLQFAGTLLHRLSDAHRSMKLSIVIMVILIIIGIIGATELIFWNRRKFNFEPKKKSSDEAEITAKVQRAGDGFAE